MNRLPLVAAATAAVALFAAAPSSAGAATLCAGPRPGCFPTIQAAVDAAHDGDTVAVAPGAFAGGITITKNIALVGSGAGKTIVRGGGPVITIGQSATGPTLTVSISRLTITGGVNTTTPASFDPFGGGVLIYPTAQGATNVVTISDSVITGNRSGAEGGGIADIGQLTLTNSSSARTKREALPDSRRKAEVSGRQVPARWARRRSGTAR